MRRGAALAARVVHYEAQNHPNALFYPHLAHGGWLIIPLGEQHCVYGLCISTESACVEGLGCCACGQRDTSQHARRSGEPQRTRTPAQPRRARCGETASLEASGTARNEPASCVGPAEASGDAFGVAGYVRQASTRHSWRCAARTGVPEPGRFILSLRSGEAEGAPRARADALGDVECRTCTLGLRQAAARRTIAGTLLGLQCSNRGSRQLPGLAQARRLTFNRRYSRRGDRRAKRVGRQGCLDEVKRFLGLGGDKGPSKECRRAW